MKPNNLAYLRHIFDAIETISNFMEKTTKDEFFRNEWDQAAIIRYLEIIGEAASQLSEDFKISHPHIPWRKVSDFRNVLVHEYFGVDLELVWKIMEKDIPILHRDISQLLKK